MDKTSHAVWTTSPMVMAGRAWTWFSHFVSSVWIKIISAISIYDGVDKRAISKFEMGVYVCMCVFVSVQV